MSYRLTMNSSVTLQASQLGSQASSAVSRRVPPTASPYCLGKDTDLDRGPDRPGPVRGPVRSPDRRCGPAWFARQPCCLSTPRAGPSRPGGAAFADSIGHSCLGADIKLLWRHDKTIWSYVRAQRRSPIHSKVSAYSEFLCRNGDIGVGSRWL